MPRSPLLQRCAYAVFAVLSSVVLLSPAELQKLTDQSFPYPERLSYRVEWRLITAGSATLDLTHPNAGIWQTNLHLESAGLVTRLYKVLDNYRVLTNDKFCAVDTYLDAEEGKRHTTTHLIFDNARHKLSQDERDLVKNTSVKKELDIAPCTYDVSGALTSLRTANLWPGKWITVPISDGKKIVSAKIEAQARETLNLDGKNYQTVRYEAFLFDNVLYRRKGRMLLWISDDSEHLPVEFRLQMGFPIGTVTIQLDKHLRTQQSTPS